MITLQDFLNKHMLKRKIKNIDLSKISGVSNQQIGCIRNGKCDASFSTAVKLIQGLGYKILITK